MKKIVVYTPLSHADQIREVIGKIGGGRQGKYSFCSFSVHGVGRFKPEEGANPHIGTVGQLESVEEERIEVTCDDILVEDILIEVKKIHPYEEIPLDVYSIENI